MQDVVEVISFSAQVSKVTTLADGGLRVVFDLAETEIEVAKQMMQAKRAGAILKIAAVPIKEKRGRKTEINRDFETPY